MYLAIALFACTVLYLVDRNKKWKAFWRVTGILAISATLFGVGLYLYSAHQDKVAAADHQCVAKVRAIYPLEYSDLSDHELAQKLKEKFHTCDLIDFSKYESQPSPTPGSALDTPQKPPQPTPKDGPWNKYRKPVK